MTTLLEQAMSKAQALPPAMQDEIARLVLTYAGSREHRAVIELTPEEEADLAEADAEVARGAFATDDEVAEIFATHQL